MKTMGDTLPAEDIVHVVPDGSEPATYHWLYVKGGFLVKLSVKTGKVIEARMLPSPKAIADKAGVPEQADTATTHTAHS
jgi:hypothetical protein